MLRQNYRKKSVFLSIKKQNLHLEEKLKILEEGKKEGNATKSTGESTIKTPFGEIG